MPFIGKYEAILEIAVLDFINGLDPHNVLLLIKVKLKVGYRPSETIASSLYHHNALIATIRFIAVKS